MNKTTGHYEAVVMCCRMVVFGAVESRDTCTMLGRALGKGKGKGGVRKTFWRDSDL